MLHIVGIVLGAGSSSRMGKPKLDLALEGRPLGQYAFDAAVRSQLTHVLFVGSGASPPVWMDHINAETEGKWSYLYCPTAHAGMAESIRCGVNKAIEFAADAVMIILADQPFQTNTLFNSLLKLYQKSGLYYLASTYHSTPMPPIIFSKSIFSKLLGLQGDIGARSLLKKENGLFEEFYDSHFAFDVDNEYEYLNAIHLMKSIKEGGKSSGDAREKCDQKGSTR
ncbi:NTP transferase domain-containing protein [Falsibacillus pallidus]|uniref:Molybdenum cofactor cytidylyltransferase n=1 Tax=Falsibacillus pallidus TaxID=493781 RepID=A0A370GQZ7_9BACI|nr:NTP transferase domain-containing protein [Falsibacillus pallidus]RDI45931.1 molybdenum cofactor cytidylyltransferase [Falsibacillus pallidus]